jgi:predicted RNA-binding protein with PUA-like domain
MQYWLLKTEPETWSWEQQKKTGNEGAEWEGVRNFQASNNLKNMKIGDECFLNYLRLENF